MDTTRYSVVAGALLASTLAATPVISVHSDYHFGFAPATIPLRIHVEPHADNRVLCIEYDGGMYSRSCQDHVGLDAPITLWKTYTNVSAGDYTLVAAIIRKDKSQRHAVIHFRVLSSRP